MCSASMNSTAFSDNTTSMSNASLTNFTKEHSAKLAWTVVSIFSIVTFILGATSNGTLLFLFLKDRSLRTPFNVYLMNLLILNLACVIIQYPMDIITNLHSQIWLLGNTGCTVYLYAIIILQGAIFNSHQLIAINRIWAAVHPISYRSAHTRVHAPLVFCLLTLIYVHSVTIPLWLSEAMYYRLSVKIYGCQFNSSGWPMYNMVTQYLVYNLPIVVMMLAFPVIWSTRIAYRRAAQRRNTVGPGRISGQVRVEFPEDGQPTGYGPSLCVPGAAVVSLAAAANGTQKLRVSQARKHRSRGYLLLALLIVSVSICWIPINVYFFLRHFHTNFESPVFYQVATILFSLQTVLDPVLFSWALSSVRTSMRRLFC